MLSTILYLGTIVVSHYLHLIYINDIPNVLSFNLSFKISKVMLRPLS